MNPSEYLRQTKELVTSIQTRFLELGARLFKIHEEKLWKGEYDSYPEFLESARISESQASIFANIHKYYVLEGGVKEERLAQIGYSSLHAALPLIERDGIEMAVVKASTLTRQEIVRDVRDPDDVCQHTKVIKICAECNKRIYDQEEKDL